MIIRKLLPNAALVLFAKHWISFRNSKDMPIKEQMKKVVKFCDYIPLQNPTFQVVNLFDRIIEFINKWNSENPDKAVNIPRIAQSLYVYENEVDRTMSVYNLDDRDEAVIYTILSELSMLDINPFLVERLVYSKKASYVIGTYHPGMSYREMQQKFDKTFKDMLVV